MSRRKFDLNYDFFKSWSPMMAYCLGLIATDGNIYDRTVSVTCHSKDEEILQYFINCIGPSTTIDRRKDRPESRVRFNSVEIVKDLNNLGIFPNKSLSIEMPNNIPDMYFFDYLRGVFDGDGWVGIQKNRLNCEFYSASPNFLPALRERCGNIGSISKRQGKRLRDVHPIFCWHCGMRDSVFLRDKMFYNECFSLKRKRDIFYKNNFITIKCQKFWTTEEQDVLLKNLNLSNKDLSILLNRSVISIYKKKYTLMKIGN